MKKWLIPVIILAVFALAIYNWAVGFNNTAVEYEANAKTAWSNVESAYQRRMDLYNSVVKTVQGVADYERETLKDVVEARAKATAINIDPSNISPEQLAKFQEAQNGYNSAFSRLLATFERYPELRATDAFRDFQTQQEGTENRINTERNRFNKAVNIYDVHTTKFPGKLLAGLFGFKEMARFKSDSEASKVPDFEFNTSKDKE